MTDPQLLYAQLVAAFKRLSWREAKEIALRLLPDAPRHAGVYGIAGVVAMELHELPQAVDYLAQATTLDPARIDFATLHAKALSASGLADQALHATDRALALAATDPAALDTLGVIYAQNHAHEQAIAVFRRAVGLSPRHARYRYNLANSLLAMGDAHAAERELEACIALDPHYWNPHLLLAGLAGQTSGHDRVERLRGLLSRHPRDTAAQTYLNMALAREYEELADYPQAFEHFVRGKSASRGRRQYSIHRDASLCDRLMQTFPLPPPTVPGNPSRAPIFIVGMPRSGTTLVERILSSHPGVRSAGELQNFPIALQWMSGSPEPLLFSAALATRTHGLDWNRLGTDYLSSVPSARTEGARFIDKLPHNFLYAGHIAHALPQASIICLRRNPLDTCLSNFRQLFDQPSPHFDYSFDLLDIGRYYILFDRLMAHWRRTFPGRILEVDYETLVDAQEATTRQLLAHCQLPWNDACMHFERNPAAVSTLSATQVRQPLYRSSIRYWQHYETQLHELRSLLAGAGIRFE
jgi:tetratricopeptide (TPR) repeat protein